MSEVDFIITDDSGTRSFDPSKLAGFGKIVQQEFTRAAGQISAGVIQRLKMAYALAIRERPRGEGQSLKEKLDLALTGRVTATENDIVVECFNLFTIDELTRNQGKWTEERGWFSFLEDGHSGQAHGSDRYQFVFIERALQLAQECSEQLHLSPQETDEFVEYVKEHFKGRYGDGIMVDLEAPLFFKYREFDHGHARNVLGSGTHPGYLALNVLENFDLEQGDWANVILGRAMQRSFNRIGT